jgi:aminopeptidase N
MMNKSARGFIAFTFLAISILISCKSGQPLVTFNPEEKSNALDSWSYDGGTSRNNELTDYRASQTKHFQLIHTKVEVSFDWEKQYLEGKASLELSPFFYPQQILTLDAKNFDIHEIKVIMENEEKALQYEYDGLQLRIELDREYKKGQKLLVSIDYTAKPNERESNGSAAITSDKGLYFINPLKNQKNKPQQIWTQGETEANSCWFPTIDAPNQRTTQEMFITVDEKFKTLSNGELIYSKINPDNTRTDYWKMDQPHAPYLFMMAIGEYSIVEDSWDEIPLYYYVEPEYEKHAKAIFGKTPEMMGFFSDLLGVKYPWNKYAQVIVRDFVSGAMENTTASVFMESVQADSNALIDQNWEKIIAHELFHHWFGDLVTCESWSNLPLNEAFANYAEYLWIEHSEGFLAAQEHAYEEREDYLEDASESGKKNLIRFFYEDKEDMFDSHSYAKGGLILHMLRREVGDEAFFATLKYYLDKHAYQSVEVHDLRLAFEKISGRDLNWFFNQWFLAAGHPELEVVHSYSQGKLKVNIIQTQNAPSPNVFQLPIVIETWVHGKAKVHQFTMTSREQSFLIDLDKAPEAVIVDPEGVLVAEITHQKTYEELYYQYQKSPYFSSKIEALVGIATLLADEEGEIDIPIELALELLGEESVALRELGIELVEGFEGAEQPLIEKKLIHIAINDKKSTLRSDALTSLAEMNYERHESLFQTSLQDSSYAVRGAALYGLSLANNENVIPILEKHENLNSSMVQIPIADFYVRNTQPNKIQYFLQLLQRFHGMDLWYFLQYTAYYALSTEDSSIKEMVVEKAYEAGGTNPNDYIRKVTYDIFNLFEELPQTSVYKAKMRDSELDMDLLEYFQDNN